MSIQALRLRMAESPSAVMAIRDLEASGSSSALLSVFPAVEVESEQV